MNRFIEIIKRIIKTILWHFDKNKTNKKETIQNKSTSGCNTEGIDKTLISDEL